MYTFEHLAPLSLERVGLRPSVPQQMEALTCLWPQGYDCKSGPWDPRSYDDWGPGNSWTCFFPSSINLGLGVIALSLEPLLQGKWSSILPRAPWLLYPSFICQTICVSAHLCSKHWQAPVWQEALISTDQLYLGDGWRKVSGVLAQNAEERKQVLLIIISIAVCVLFKKAASSYCPCLVPQWHGSFPNVLSGCAIYPFVFSATANPLRARSISAVKIIPVKTVKNASGLVLPPGILLWVGFFLFNCYIMHGFLSLFLLTTDCEA